MLTELGRFCNEMTNCSVNVRQPGWGPLGSLLDDTVVLRLAPTFATINLEAAAC